MVNSSAWSRTIDPVHGLCYTFNENQLIPHKFVDLGKLENAEMNLVLSFSKAFQWFQSSVSFKVHLHDKQESFLFKKYDAKQEIFVNKGRKTFYQIEKQVIKTLPINGKKCDLTVIGTENACFELKAIEKFKQKFKHCALPWFPQSKIQGEA